MTPVRTARGLPAELDDDLLRLIVESLQLTPEQYSRAVASYTKVTKYLGLLPSPFAAWDPDLYPQGSMATGLTTRPPRRQEFDLDLVMELRTPVVDPIKLLDAAHTYLEAHDEFGPIVERRDRCIRLNYPGNFHLDVVPACSDADRPPTGIVVPDRDLSSWKASNPRGLAGWFATKMVPIVRVDNMMAKSASIAPPPRNAPAEEKTPLQLAIQILKRSRDLHFEHTSNVATPSILIMVLAATYYDGGIDIAATLRGVTAALVALSKGPAAPLVRNPADPAEVISEKWTDPRVWEAFGVWITEIQALLESEQRPLDILESLVGKTAVDAGMRAQAARVAAASAASTIRPSPRGVIVGVPSAVPTRPAAPQHNFYGE